MDLKLWQFVTVIHLLLKIPACDLAASWMLFAYCFSQHGAQRTELPVLCMLLCMQLPWVRGHICQRIEMLLWISWVFTMYLWKRCLLLGYKVFLACGFISTSVWSPNYCWPLTLFIHITDPLNVFFVFHCHLLSFFIVSGSPKRWSFNAFKMKNLALFKCCENIVILFLILVIFIVAFLS